MFTSAPGRKLEATESDWNAPPAASRTIFAGPMQRERDTHSALDTLTQAAMELDGPPDNLNTLSRPSAGQDVDMGNDGGGGTIADKRYPALHLSTRQGTAGCCSTY